MDDLASGDANIQTAMLEAISEAISGAVLVYDRNDLIVFASQQLLGLLPVSRKFLAPGTRLRDFLGAVYDGGGRLSSDGHGSRRMMSREDWIAKQIATLWKERAEAVEQRGTDRWVSYSRRRLPSGYGICVVRDVSEHKKREEQWRADLDRVQITEEILDNLPFPLCVQDHTFHYVAVNKAICRSFDRPADAILGRTIQEIHPDAFAERLDGVNRQVLETGNPSTMLEGVIHADGTESVIVVRKFRIGKPGRYHVVSVLEDVTALDNLDPQTQGVTSWPDGVGPISSGIGGVERQDGNAADIVLEGADGRRVLVVTSASTTEAAALETLAGLGLDTSSVTSPEELDLFLRMAHEAAIDIDLVIADAEMDVRCLGLADQYGIPVLVLDGRSAADDLAASVLRKLRDETAADDIDWQVCAMPVVYEGIDVLVAEDNEVNQIVFSQILEGLGYRYVLAADGEAAVRLWQEHRPRVVLMDITLPKRNGFEAAREIRALEGGLPATPIIGVLPQAFDRDREACLAAGMDGVILKPISPEALEAVFQTHLNGEMRKLQTHL
ncbi:response regulator [Rhizobium sp. LC145]|uniref:response regulator n=1 Tax=Rhizobium sp. LC145 TaxID=1120688 RepID=UPI000629FB7F|nr:response regulator [Rhizobium sp. LC145]KKX24692.1 hypothetical protein YH62_27160 [Rhizobium sp. LC145]TKT42613.1 response regulator [Rhizobiaceae bacterium LC148]